MEYPPPASSNGETTCAHDEGSDDDLADTAAIASGSSVSPDIAAIVTGPGTHHNLDEDLFLQAGVAGIVVTVAIPTPLPVAPANIITAALPQAIGQAVQAIGSIMPWKTFGIGCALVPSNTRAANMQSRRERSASVSQRRPTGDGRRSPSELL